MHIAEYVVSDDLVKIRTSASQPKISNGLLPHEDDTMVVIVQMLNFNTHRVLIDPDSTINILYWEAFEGM